MNKIYTIGDIHGELSKLKKLIYNILLEDDQPSFIFLGDYVDRGPDSYGVIEYLLELNKSYKCIFICGNHDQVFFDDVLFNDEAYHPNKYTLWNQGAKQTYESYKSKEISPEVHLPFYKMLLPYYILTINEDKHLFIHGGYNRHKLIEEQKLDSVFWWDRDLLMAAKSYDSMHDKRYKFKNKDQFKFIYVGHTPVQMWGLETPQLWGNVWALDTGVGKSITSELHALEVTTQTLIK